MFEGEHAVTAQVISYGAVAMAKAEGDELELVVREHSRLVYRVVYSVLRNHHDAEDATQETFLRVLRYGAKLQEVRDQRTWLARIAWRVAINRRKRPESGTDSEHEAIVNLPSPSAAADEIVLAEQVGQLLEKLIAGLPGKLRDPLTLSTLEEMTPADVAQIMEISEAAVRARVFRARQILRQRMAAHMGENHATRR
jgi:RNA polymerase sigma-70 factor (ECF subfamily)